jgi:hypothetical protein
MILQYSDEGVEIETVLPYGNSRRAEGSHFTDQMEMYAKQERKVMSLDKEKVLLDAIRHYHPK